MKKTERLNLRLNRADLALCRSIAWVDRCNVTDVIIRAIHELAIREKWKIRPVSQLEEQFNAHLEASIKPPEPEKIT